MLCGFANDMVAPQLPRLAAIGLVEAGKKFFDSPREYSIEMPNVVRSPRDPAICSWDNREERAEEARRRYMGGEWKSGSDES